MNINTISLSELKTVLPQAFVQTPSDRVSKRYGFIPTHTILQDLEVLGWKVRQVVNPKYKSVAKMSHGKHLVRLFNPEIHISSGNDVNHVEIALYNSSDGLSRFKMEVGIFRMVCENGMVIKSHDFGSINMKHTAYSFDALTIAINEMIEKLPELAGVINKFAAKVLSPVEMRQLALGAYELRGGGRVATEAELLDILQVRRPEDEGNDLWKIFNRIQESVVRGGQAFVDARGRVRNMKPLLNLDKSLKANQDLWQLAESFA
jgi:hypothetical protein